MTRAELREVWRERIAAFRASGLSVRNWCTEQGIKEHQLRYWLRRLLNGPLTDLDTVA